MNANKTTIVLTVILCVVGSLGGCSHRIVYQQPELHLSANALNINAATVDELERLPHIGRKTAETIVQFREENGPFRRVEHLMQIRGISEKRFAELRPYLRTK